MAPHKTSYVRHTKKARGDDRGGPLNSPTSYQDAPSSCPCPEPRPAAGQFLLIALFYHNRVELGEGGKGDPGPRDLAARLGATLTPVVE
jgi:hypothetical protein